MLIIVCALTGLLAGRFIIHLVPQIPQAINQDRDELLALFERPAAGEHAKQSRTKYRVMLITSGLFAALAATLGWGAPLLMMLVLLCWLLTLALIDLDTMLLPDILTLSLLWLGLIFNLLTGFTAINAALWGAMTGYALPWILATGYSLLRQREGLGLGDAKLLAALGAWLGWSSLPRLLILSCGLMIIGVLLRKLCYKTAMHQAAPFGPALALAGFYLALLRVL
jgi:prepilin signal peptidase PulO-like enzyme (type II secretory pathway)